MRNLLIYLKVRIILLGVRELLVTNTFTRALIKACLDKLEEDGTFNGRKKHRVDYSKPYSEYAKCRKIGFDIS